MSLNPSTDQNWIDMNYKISENSYYGSTIIGAKKHVHMKQQSEEFSLQLLYLIKEREIVF